MIPTGPWIPPALFWLFTSQTALLWLAVWARSLGLDPGRGAGTVVPFPEVMPHAAAAGYGGRSAQLIPLAPFLPAGRGH